MGGGVIDMREMAVHWHSLPADFITKEENISTYIAAERKKNNSLTPRGFMQVTWTCDLCANPVLHFNPHTFNLLFLKP